MCSRFTLTSTPDKIAEELSVKVEAAEPQYNIAPTDPVQAILEHRDGERELKPLRWGLVPFWAKDPKIGARMINARIETVHETNAYKRPFHERRCLVLADGFYEWYRQGNLKRTFYIRRADHEPFAFAGLFARWRSKDESERIESCTVVTRDSLGKVARVHDRMPAVLRPEHYEQWIDRSFQETGEVRAILEQADLAGEFEAIEVSSFVNNVRHEGPQCIQPLPEDKQANLFDGGGQ